MKISIVVATSANNVIGVDGGLPWHLPEDLKRFRQITMGKPMIMGRATFESIGRALPGRKSIVLTRQPDFEAEGCVVVPSIEAALKAAGDADEVMVIGGGEIYRQFLARADRIYLTRLQAELEGDTTFPELDMDEWEVVAVEEYPAGDERELGFDVETMERVAPGPGVLD
ncbi:MAG: type 3 dihydrofolate reductase [Gammaproteobacteria bacterium]|nr:type 3 dihydrofolate reductase [Gammaproteobacteria bacterium]